MDARLPDHRRQTALITVLKNGTHLRNLVALLGQLNLARTPVLVIDDEADQAGLNTQAARGGESTTYQRLVALRKCLPHHTYLQYTATPQAPLLINLIDTLSPKFAELLTPGDDYVGGEAFFEQHRHLVRVIPEREIPSQSNRILQPPQSLIDALKLYFVGVAVGFIGAEDQRAKNRSMLVHPSRETPGHSKYHGWIMQLRHEWLRVLNLSEGAPERRHFVASFRLAFEDLRKTVSDLPSFSQIADELEYAIRKTEILQVNAQPITPPVDWRMTYPWILVGGQAMDRGFTVEGLTLTYMPREMGVGNADTIQQRARFLGYKRSYLGFCRVFLERGLLKAFRAYVAHERDIRQRLSEHRGRPLSEWRRAFFLETALRPTRRNVLDLDYRQDTYSNRWFWPKVPHGTDELLQANRETVSRFVASVPWQVSKGDPRRTDDQVHLVAERVPLRRAYEELLTPLRFTHEHDSQLFTGVLLQIGEYLQAKPEATCTVYRMKKGLRRGRTVNDDEVLSWLFQGPNYADAAKSDVIYPGDERIRSSGLTIQIHTLQVRVKNPAQVIANNVPAIAVWVPAPMRRGWLVQEHTSDEQRLQASTPQGSAGKLRKLRIPRR
jgi:hypothetical protein